MATKYSKLHDESPEAPRPEQQPASQQQQQQPASQQHDTSANWNQQPLPAVVPYSAIQPTVPPMQHSQQQQQSSNTTVVLGQPAPAPLSVVAPQPPPPPKPLILILAIVFAIVTTFFGVWPSWLCLYPGVIFAIVGYSLFDSHREDQRKTATIFNSLAIGLMVAGMVTFGFCMVLFIIYMIAVTT